MGQLTGLLLFGVTAQKDSNEQFSYQKAQCCISIHWTDCVHDTHRKSYIIHIETQALHE